MLQVGVYHFLIAQRATSVGWFLSDSENNEVLLPQKWVPPALQAKDKIKVFVYLDASQRPIATTQEPLAAVGDFAYLKVRQVTSFGAFLDWGLEKDLLVSFSEMESPMQEGKSYLVALYLDDKTNRVVGSSRLKRFFKTDTANLEIGQQVAILVWQENDLGVQVVAQNAFSGLLYHQEIFEPLRPGQRRHAFITSIRADGKLDLILQKPGYQNIEPNAEKVLQLIKAKNGFLPLHDKSSPQEISAALKMSKKTFKKAVGTLYKQKIIDIETGKGLALKK
jgi:predicted RNA-binding protein (virulence factor B family)